MSIKSMFALIVNDVMMEQRLPNSSHVHRHWLRLRSHLTFKSPEFGRRFFYRCNICMCYDISKILKTFTVKQSFSKSCCSSRKVNAFQLMDLCFVQHICSIYVGGSRWFQIRVKRKDKRDEIYEPKSRIIYLSLFQMYIIFKFELVFNLFLLECYYSLKAKH